MKDHPSNIFVHKTKAFLTKTKLQAATKQAGEAPRKIRMDALKLPRTRAEVRQMQAIHRIQWCLTEVMRLEECTNSAAERLLREPANVVIEFFLDALRTSVKRGLETFAEICNYTRCEELVDKITENKVQQIKHQMSKLAQDQIIDSICNGSILKEIRPKLSMALWTIHLHKLKRMKNKLNK